MAVEWWYFISSFTLWVLASMEMWHLVNEFAWKTHRWQFNELSMPSVRMEGGRKFCTPLWDKPVDCYGYWLLNHYLTVLYTFNLTRAIFLPPSERLLCYSWPVHESELWKNRFVHLEQEIKQRKPFLWCQNRKTLDQVKLLCIDVLC